MKKKTKKKVITLVKYFFAWLATIGVGFACWLIIYVFNTTGYMLTDKASAFWFGFAGGILGTLCYFMAWSLFVPIVKWIWGKIRHSPKGFIELVNGKKVG